MLFFKSTGTIVGGGHLDELESTPKNSKLNRKIAISSSRLYRSSNETTFCFVSEMGTQSLTLGIITTECELPTKLKSEFLEMIEVSVEDESVTEITFGDMYDMLRRAKLDNMVDSIRGVLENFGIDTLSCGNYGENLVKERSQREVKNLVKQKVYGPVMQPEIDRIYTGEPIRRPVGHPVHYIVCTDDKTIRREIPRLLLSALYDRGRIQNRRYCYININPKFPNETDLLESIYQSCVGGAVILRMAAGMESDGEYASSIHEDIERFSRLIKKHRNRVLTFLCFEQGCVAAKELFMEYLGGICFVEIKEEGMNRERAVAYLGSLARADKIRPDSKLYAGLDEDEKYFSFALRNRYDEWHDAKLRKKMFAQYADIAALPEHTETGGIGKAYDTLQQMIGLGEAKKVINSALNYFKAQRLFADKGMVAERPSMHMVFTGNPGTAKTTVARLFAQIMKENQLLSRGTFIEVGRADLVGRFVGWTAPTIQKKFKEAEGGVLFIDEAYSLVDRQGSFGDEAINTIVQEMENHRRDVVVIFAGYPNEMEQFLQKNPGLRSRIAFHVPFEDYSADELCGIADLISTQKGMKLAPEARDKLQTIFDMARRRGDFGNGRYVRNVIERAKMAQAGRLMSMDFDKISESEVVTLCAEDIEVPPEAAPTTHTIGFCA